MSLVEVRCKARGCGKLRCWLESAPPDNDAIGWSGMVPIPACPRHGGPAGGSVARWVEARRRHGLPHDQVTISQYVYWAELRSAVLQARRTGQTQVYRL